MVAWLSGRFRRTIIIGSALALLIAGSAMQFSGEMELRVAPVDDDGPLLVLPLIPGEPFTLHYYHSVENAPIWEVHTLDATGRIFIEEERYLKFGAGMGKMPGVGRMVNRGPFEAIVDMHMPTGDFVLRIGSPGVDHTVIWRGTRTNLSAMAPHRAVQFSGRPVSLAYALWRRIIPHPATPN
jgi:hypothetical protein